MHKSTDCNNAGASSKMSKAGIKSEFVGEVQKDPIVRQHVLNGD